MPKRLGKFELPSKLTKVEEGATPTYAKFIAEPFEAGYGHTVGNSLRRVLLSSIEGSAISSIKIDGVNHEFQSVDGVVEDVTDIVLNLKKILIVSEKRESMKLLLKVNGRKVDIASYTLNAGDTIEIKASNNSRQIVTRSVEESRARVVPGWLTRNDEALSAVVNRLPTRDEMDPSINEQLIVEFYSRF